MEFHPLSENLAFGSQPAPEDMERLAAKGVRTVINLRFADEEEPHLPPDKEREAAERLGMRFVNIPVSAANMNADTAARVGEAIGASRADGAVFVH